ncbi:transporter substrate-binding domain-containing protein [bacterium]|nr:MAG: transporter substrate-binding domain-containing protein [bacterium]
MKQFILTLVLGIILAGNVTAQLKGDTYADALKNKKATIVAVYLEEEAFAFKDADGKVSGIEGDIFSHFVNWLKNAKGIDLKVSYIGEKSFAKFYEMVQNGSQGVVGLGTTTILDRRKSEVKFSPPFINNIAVLISNSSIPNLSSLNAMGTEFSKLKGLAAKGTTLEGYLRNATSTYYPNAKLEFLPSQGEVAEKVAQDPSYFAYVDLSVYWPAFDKQKMAIKRHPVGDLASETFGFIMPLDSDWDKVINEFFSLGTGYRSTAAYRNILMKHLGVEVTKMLEIARNQNSN